MSDYRRFISYIYAYEREIKSKNVGFAKVEVRNGECRITISIKGAFAASEKELETYLFYRREEMLPGISVGKFPVRNGAGEFHCVVEADNINGSGMPLEDMCGIILRHEKEDTRMYASGWDDLAIVPWRLMRNGADHAETAGLMQEKKGIGTEIVTVEENPVIAAVEEGLRMLETAAEAAVQEAETIQSEAPALQEQECAAACEEQSKAAEAAGLVHKDLWTRLEDAFPRIAAFEDEPELECLKIDLKDLENLPRENWGLANNSFLLHGYYNFRYLILGKLKEDEYMLGVPGMFHNNERFLAAMFGFEYFKAVKEYKPLTGHFGYWYRRVVL